MLLDVAGLPEELLTLRGRVETFIAEEILPLEQGLAENEEPSRELLREARVRSEAAGVFRLGLPVAEGGGGQGPLAMTVVREAIAASGSRLGRALLGAGGGMLRGGTEAQKRRFLEPVLRGEMTTAFAFTDAREGPRTTARRGEDGHFLISGVKSFVTGGPQADLLLVVAQVTENAGGPTGAAVFLVPREAPGVELRRTLRTLDGGTHGEFGFHETPVAETDILGAVGQGLPRALSNIDGMRLSLGANASGTAAWTLRWLLEQIARPHRTGVPLAEREQVQAMLADAAAAWYAARTALYDAARKVDAGQPANIETAIAKAQATEAAAKVVDVAIQLTGGAAVVEGHPLERLYRLVRGWRIAEGTTEILRLTIARGLLEQVKPKEAE